MDTSDVEEVSKPTETRNSKPNRFEALRKIQNNISGKQPQTVEDKEENHKDKEVPQQLLDAGDANMEDAESSDETSADKAASSESESSEDEDEVQEAQDSSGSSSSDLDSSESNESSDGEDPDKEDSNRKEELKPNRNPVKRQLDNEQGKSQMSTQLS